MLQKIFVLIATFCMAEGKLILKPPLGKISVSEQGEISRKIYQFPVYAFLSPVWDIEGSKESFPECYEKHGNGYLDVFDPFSTKILGAMNRLNNRLPSWSGKINAIYVRKRTEHIPKLLEKYKEDFEKKVKGKKSSEIETLAKKYQTLIDEELIDLYTELKIFEKRIIYALYKGAFSDCYKEFQDGIDTAVKKCKGIVEKIKDCMEKENAKLTEEVD